ncbi:MAG: outer membrane beta-barrel protein [Acidobacteriota bacterium]
MRQSHQGFLPFALFLSLPLSGFSQKQELGLTLGGIAPQDRGFARLSGGTALQANYGYRIWTNEKIAIFGEVHFLANGQRKITSSDPRTTRDVATLYVTPGLRVKFALKSRVSPYLAVGGGYALYEQSLFQLSGAANQAPRFRNGAALDYGAGFDVKLPEKGLLSRVNMRGEVRDFYSGSPDFNVAAFGGRQHNVVIGGGFVIKLGKR